jgi:hypothetical protein
MRINYKNIFFILCAVFASQVLRAYSQKINDIELKVIDCAKKPDEILISMPSPVALSDIFITINQFLQRDIHPVYLQISNNSKNPIMILQKSITKQINPEDAARMFHINFGPFGCLIYLSEDHIKTFNEHLDQIFNQTFTEQFNTSKAIINPGLSATKIVLLNNKGPLEFTCQVFDQGGKEVVASFTMDLKN